ncbi:MAG TPA: tyrosine/phenylalanine carboxypeptidase domain-containing protein [Thermoanaerobaculia bacterium]|nr:tyrosine/phenylalanine carboxypeptidase domain-containing protein [Thermoanaerobaculia bacterium]
MSDRGIGEELLTAIEERLRQGRRVRRLLPGGGRIHVDRRVPFLCVYRSCGGDTDGVERFVATQASYLVAADATLADPRLPQLVERVARTLAADLGAFLLVEMWEGRVREETAEPMHRIRPAFRVMAEERGPLEPTLDALQSALREVRYARREASVELVEGPVAPPGCPQLLPRRLPGVKAFSVGLVVEPVYRSADRSSTFPMVLLALEKPICRALEKAVFEFARGLTVLEAPHFLAMGRRTLAGAAWNVDRRLELVSESFDFLLLVTPINGDEAWRRFRDGDDEEAPRFLYRPLPLDPQLVKRALFGIPIERVEDPVLSSIFREKQEELDRQVSMLLDRGSRRFLYGSLLLYGGVEEGLLTLARSILERVPTQGGDDAVEGPVSAATFARRAREEVEWYRQRDRGFTASVQVRRDLPPGLLVSRGCLMIGEGTSLSAARVEALLHHEVGTHLLTYFNGRAQRIRQFYCGLAGYETLQEGIAVLAEWLCGGLSRARLRTLAARVVTCHHLVEGASFVDAYRHLLRDHGFRRRSAFLIATRVYRGGGLTKDAIYLRGLMQLIAHLGRGGDFEMLLVGKIATRHIPVVRDLWYRNFFRPPPLRPRYLENEAARDRLAAVREGGDLLELLRLGDAVTA